MSELSLKDLFTWVSTIVGLAAIWFRNQYRIERLVEKDEEQARQINALWKWKESHDQVANDQREKYNRELSELRGMLLVSGEQFKQIMSVLQDIKERLGELEKRTDRRSNG